jgi:CO/xanthine dehydrogenase Mo-binding subunit
VKLVVRKNFVGVVAEKQWQAIQAARRLKVYWNPGSVLPAQKTFFESLRKQASRETMLVNSKDTEEQLAGAYAVVEATYAYPYQMHGSIGSSCAVADVERDRATIWSATQSPYPTRNVVAKLLGLEPDNVRVVYVRGSGCYGLNGADAVSFDAAMMSQAIGRPVRVQLSRQDEMAWENFGAACVVEQRAGLDQNGKIVAWECNTWNTAKGNRPGYDRPGNVITGELLGFPPEEMTPGSAQEPKGPLRNASNFVPSYFAGCAAGKCAGSGTIRSEKVLAHTVASPFFTGPLRSPLRIQNTFAHECFIDELCVRAQADPVYFRLQHLSDGRVIGVLKAAADAAKWEERRTPKMRSGSDQIVSGRGVACVAYEGDNGYAALIVDVNVDLATGRVEPSRFVMAIDAGPISNPDGLRNQTEGGLLQGMSRALNEEMTWDHERVTSNDWETYRSLYMDLKLPSVELVLVNRDDVPATGAGETAITVVPGAIGNAIFDATGVRLREVPFTAERVKAALSAAGCGESR